MTSAEPARTTSYSPDIGWRVVWQRIGMGLTFKEIATHLQIGVSTAHRVYTRYIDTGDVVARKQPERPDKLVRIQPSTSCQWVLLIPVHSLILSGVA